MKIGGETLFSGKEYRSGMGYIVATIVILATVGGALTVAGVFGERVVFENSFQYKEGMRQRSVVLEAQVAEINMQIGRNPGMAAELIAQRKVLEIQLMGVRK